MVSKPHVSSNRVISATGQKICGRHCVTEWFNTRPFKELNQKGFARSNSVGELNYTDKPLKLEVNHRIPSQKASELVCLKGERFNRALLTLHLRESRTSTVNKGLNQVNALDTQT